MNVQDIQIAGVIATTADGKIVDRELFKGLTWEGKFYESVEPVQIISAQNIIRVVLNDECNEIVSADLIIGMTPIPNPNHEEPKDITVEFTTLQEWSPDVEAVRTQIERMTRRGDPRVSSGMDPKVLLDAEIERLGRLNAHKSDVGITFNLPHGGQQLTMTQPKSRYPHRLSGLMTDEEGPLNLDLEAHFASWKFDPTAGSDQLDAPKGRVLEDAEIDFVVPLSNSRLMIAPNSAMVCDKVIPVLQSIESSPKEPKNYLIVNIAKDDTKYCGYILRSVVLGDIIHNVNIIPELPANTQWLSGDEHKKIVFRPMPYLSTIYDDKSINSILRNVNSVFLATNVDLVLCTYQGRVLYGDSAMELCGVPVRVLDPDDFIPSHRSNVLFLDYDSYPGVPTRATLCPNAELTPEGVNRSEFGGDIAVPIDQLNLTSNFAKYPAAHKGGDDLDEVLANVTSTEPLVVAPTVTGSKSVYYVAVHGGEIVMADPNTADVVAMGKLLVVNSHKDAPEGLVDVVLGEYDTIPGRPSAVYRANDVDLKELLATGQITIPMIARSSSGFDIPGIRFKTYLPYAIAIDHNEFQYPRFNLTK
ncbi:hypothetical protein pEaSNUABM54_00025 [Erwinia phage pEa_SNUABM_54]|nr:hypothetical protein pEaSNUABM54_00025 [Erwinia phage pEa_SNUABM_54]